MTSIQCLLCDSSFPVTTKNERYCDTCKPYKNVLKSNKNWLERGKKKSKVNPVNIGYLFKPSNNKKVSRG